MSASLRMRDPGAAGQRSRSRLRRAA
jgi:hypothetical protein